MRGPHPVFESFPQVVLNSEPNAVRHRAARDCPLSIGVPVVEHLAQLRQQSLADGGPVSAAINQGLEVAFEVCPTDLPLLKRIITAVAIGTHYAAIIRSQGPLNGGRRAGQTDPGSD